MTTYLVQGSEPEMKAFMEHLAELAVELEQHERALGFEQPGEWEGMPFRRSPCPHFWENGEDLYIWEPAIDSRVIDWIEHEPNNQIQSESSGNYGNGSGDECIVCLDCNIAYRIPDDYEVSWGGF